MREWWNDATRTYKTYSAAGAETSTRPYTAAENAEAEAAATELLAITNKGAVETNIVTDMAAMQMIINDTNANINANPAARIKDIARAIRRLDRMALARFEAAD
jgi:hypothetical protein